jgi:hypothetical protein
MTDSAQRLGWPSDGEMLDLLIASGYDAEQVHPACYRAFGWKTFTEKLKAALRSSALPEPCEYCGGGKRTGLPGNACENCMNTGLKYPEHAVRSHDLYKGLDDALVALHGLLDFPGDRESWDEAKATYSRLQPLLNDDEPVPSALPETDVMRSAARAKDVVSGWSDAKRNYADRVTAPSALPETGEIKPAAWQRRIKNRNGEWLDWVECSADPDDQQRWRNIGGEIRQLYTRPSPDGAVRFHRSTEVSDAPIGQASAEDDAP